MSEAAETQVANETFEEKRARLQRELVDLEREEAAKKKQKVATKMQRFFASPLLGFVIAKAIAEQLKFGEVELMDGLSDHLYSRLQNVRHGKAVSLAFTDASGQRRYECALTASNDEQYHCNRAELRALTRKPNGHDLLAVKPMSVGLVFSCWEDLCALAETAGGTEYVTRFTASMLPFDDEINELLTRSADALRQFDLALLAHTIAAARTYADAHVFLKDDRRFDLHCTIDLAIQNISMYHDK